jgi:hypothetical protein
MLASVYPGIQENTVRFQYVLVKLAETILTYVVEMETVPRIIIVNVTQIIMVQNATSRFVIHVHQMTHWYVTEMETVLRIINVVAMKSIVEMIANTQFVLEYTSMNQ